MGLSDMAQTAVILHEIEKLEQSGHTTGQEEELLLVHHAHY